MPPSRAAADVRESTARCPGTSPPELERLLAGDLDHVILKAMHKEPARRYPTAAALAADVQLPKG